MAIITDIKKLAQDIKFLERKTHAELGAERGTSGKAVQNLMTRQNSQSLTPATVDLFELLGYDLKIVPVKRRQQKKTGS